MDAKKNESNSWIVWLVVAAGGWLALFFVFDVVLI